MRVTAHLRAASLLFLLALAIITGCSLVVSNKIDGNACEADEECDSGSPCIAGSCNEGVCEYDFEEEGEPCGVGFICLEDGSCDESVCGDAIVDFRSESCDPPELGECGPDCLIPCLRPEQCNAGQCEVARCTEQRCEFTLQAEGSPCAGGRGTCDADGTCQGGM